MAVSGRESETLVDIPAHVWRGLPDGLRLAPSAVNPDRIGVWASCLIPKGKRFGPFVGERKKRSQVTSNVYMWEVYFPTRGWMCVDATDPTKGNWLRYVNWACSPEEQNLFPLEINRAIYYKVLRPIAQDEELLVWYNGEDNPEIAAALEEERNSNFYKKNSPRAKRARKKKLLEKARQAGLGILSGHKPLSTRPIVTEMRDSDKEINKEEERPSVASDPAQETAPSCINPTETRDISLSPVHTAVLEKKEKEKSDQKELQPSGSFENSAESQSGNRCENLDSESIFGHSVKESSESPLPEVTPVSSLVTPELDAEGEPDFVYDAQGGNYHCQYCEHKFSTKHSLEHHINIHTTRNHQTLTFKCRYCSKPFGSQVGKRRHERRHENGSKGLKRPGSLAGAVFLQNPSGCNDTPIFGSVTSSSPTIKSTQNSPSHLSSDTLTKDASVEPDQSFILEENGESKELHPCKYCNKAFGTHTNMRRHQRRIHERHLLPKGIRRKGILLQDIPAHQLQQGQSLELQEASPRNSPPLVYVPSVDTDDEGEREDSMVDVSKNISENLSLYIDGKILSTSTVSGCDVIEVDSRSPALFGLDAVILNHTQISQALQLETQSCHVNELSVIDQSVPKRRTSTPPLLPTVKTEPSTMLSTVSSSSASSQSPSLGGNIFPQPTETLAFQKEKTVYLSPKLKQLLQTQDSQKPTLAIVTDSHKLTTPLSVTSLPAAQGKFKRRTASPTNVQNSSSTSADSSIVETGDSFALIVPKVESHCTSFSWSVSSKEQRDCMSPSGKDWPVSVSGGNSCNQQPLDLSGAVGKRGGSINKGPSESVLDLSVHHKNVADHKTKSSILLQSHVKRKKPNTSMLEKVLMNEYSGLSSAGEEGSPCLGSPDIHLSSGSTTVVSPSSGCSNSEPLPCESVSPPSLTPVTMNPSSPSSSSQASSTPPPPVLPTVPSPPPLSQFSDSVFPKLSPKPVYHMEDEMPRFHDVKEEYLDRKNQDDKDFDDKDKQTSKQFPPDDVLPQSLEVTKSHCDADSFCKSETLFEGSTSDPDLHLLKNIDNTISLHEKSIDSNGIQKSSFHRPSPQGHNNATDVCQKLQSSSPVHLALDMDSSSHNVAADSNIEPLADDALINDKLLIEDSVENTTTDGVSSTCVPENIPDGADTLEQDMFTKSFVCNVCEKPFHSIKQLSNHIIDHALEWPFKCEFCVQLFQNSAALLKHRSSLHGVGRIYCCPICAKEFAFLCNLQQHQTDLHPGQAHAHTMVENGKLRPQNYTDPSQLNTERNSLHSTADTTIDVAPQDPCELLNCSGVKEEGDGVEHEDPTEELYTTIKIMASEAGKPKCPDVRLGINQHYPSFKPPPFPYHSRTPADSVASATNFTTHNIPQTFSTAIRCTKCGNSFDNMPELHKHILVCANASDKRRYTPKKNPIPLRQIVSQPQNGVFSPITAANGGQNAFRRMGQPKRLNFNQEVPTTVKMSVLNKKKNQLVQKAISQKNKAANSIKKASNQEVAQDVQACPYCSREFTYAASLAKHVACSCPQKPVAKKKKGALMPQNKNMKLRSRASDSEIKQEGNLCLAIKSLGKTRTRSSELLEGEVTSGSNGKAGDLQIRVKRPALNKHHLAPKSKKGRKSKPEPSVMTSSLTLASQPSAKMQRGGKDMALKKEAETKPQVQPKKEKRFSKRMRERVGGPMTRSLQMASATSPGEVKTEDPLISEPVHGEYKESCIS
ncbi:PR domain zinc finger protein 2 isoform X1 [Tachysurus fulvidraco]|uniref:PR domain zinc finger protein 2 isoform X1 n=2 Tax=Tachysurus fulvidraco TaxID=1234273 RepID=UPI001FEE817F|nr:PR domain zinc finger protein 2 isoform X1 [Tachysurus fulvidraco]XP_047663935.1 PR domain zinc finger protein 2 isoform X1 [Tachysurus fulvidraco]XP_047663938.1 PR domain zinc finger protein 2 isoform X1 [Tachysurus fulvidraco]